MFNPKAVYIDTDAFSVYGSELLRYLKSKIGVYLLLLVFSLIIGSTLFYFSSPKYQAVASFVLEERSPSSGVAGIASQMGVDLGALAGGSSGLLSVENIQEIVQSSRIMEQALLAAVPGKKTSFADLYVKASGMANERGWKEKLATFSAAFPDRDTALQVIMKRIREKDLQVERINKKGSIFRVTINAADPVFAIGMSTKLVELTSALYVNIKTQTLAANVAKAEVKADSLRQLLGGKIAQTYSYQVLDANRFYTQNMIGAEMSTSDRSVLFALYAEVMKNLEWSRMMLISQTPVIQVLDQPKLPLVDMRWSLFLYLLVAAFIATAFYLLFGLFTFNPSSIAKKSV
jgi:hypothetical protein